MGFLWDSFYFLDSLLFDSPFVCLEDFIVEHLFLWVEAS